MVNPVEASARLLGVNTDDKEAKGPGDNLGRLFTLMLMTAGHGGCACDTCQFGRQLQDVMIARGKESFSPSPGAPPASPPAPASPVPAYSALPTPPAPPPQAPPPPVSTEAPDV